MSKQGKDSLEVAEFMALFAKLKEWSDDDPDGLFDFAAGDESVRKLCIDLWFSARFLKMNERRARRLFATPVDPLFVAGWRDYEERYESVVSSIWISTILPEFAGAPPTRVPKADQEWKIADDEAEQQSSGIGSAIYWARCEVENDNLDGPEGRDLLRALDEGVTAWERLIGDHGLDLRGVFRRRALVPFVLVPRSIAAKHGSAEKLSMLKNLQQAHDAFVFGASYAALALMRSIMEAVLRDHYRADGKDMNERIQNARRQLPPGANDAALHRLRKRANAILHLDQEKDEGLPELDEVRLEKEIVSLLFVLRALIEGAK
jgi:hypothetical protein